MYRIFLQSVALAGLLFVCHFVRAQQASIQLIIPPPVELANRDQWNLLLLASTFDTLQVLLHGTVTEQMRGKVYEVNSAVFTLRPGNYLFNTSNYTLLEPEQVLFESRDFVEHISRTNTLPGGQYEVCVELVDMAQNIVITQTCTRVDINLTTPPALISPANGFRQCELLPLFVWAPPQPPLTNQNIEYELRVFEVQGNQTPVAAVAVNPFWYVARNISAPIHQYELSARPWISGRQYAWYVIAYTQNVTLGTSEIWSFEHQNCLESEVVPDGQPAEQPAINKQVPGVQYFELKAGQGLAYYLLRNSRLHIAFKHELIGDQVYLKIEDNNGNTIDAWQTPARYGWNFVSLDTDTWTKRPVNQAYYRLIIMDTQGHAQSLRFQYLTNP